MTNILLSVDLKTLILLTVLNFLINGIFLLFVFGIRHRSFIQWLAYGCFLFALGWLFFLYRFVNGINLITLPLANVLILAMPIFLGFSIDSFLGKRRSKIILGVIAFVLLFTFLFLSWIMHDKWIPGMYTSIINGIFYSIPGIYMLKFATPKNIIVWAIIGLNFLISLLLIVRSFILLLGWLYPDTINETIVMGILVGVLCLNIICINAQVLCFPILDFTEAQKELILANRKLEDLSNIDDLTGLPNRRALRVKLDQEAAYHAENNLPFSIILFDLDHFKLINDKFGHLVGDSVLKNAASLLKQLVRPSDLVMRYGGEEFMVLLPETESSEAFIVAERLRLGISQFQFSYSDPSVAFQVTASFGVSTLNANLLNVTELVRRADIALYRAKTEGRNRVCIE
ncbi:GGDEF domain-containing protein [Spirulina sp. CCNP1310]|uniref:GGDEF domain-containing protein n=1 Tax=Spirulina sp. CCNP1310 TaxID=3110249 RepID=UPI002B21B1C8|nr:GGDEF domain-containing protein [Spirulina sp. CCNP1310]MEA5419102.1 GGDEF domain-containing protein [Spirulina sp. CCNP1310]